MRGSGSKRAQGEAWRPGSSETRAGGWGREGRPRKAPSEPAKGETREGTSFEQLLVAHSISRSLGEQEASGDAQEPLGGDLGDRGQRGELGSNKFE